MVRYLLEEVETASMPVRYARPAYNSMEWRTDRIAIVGLHDLQLLYGSYPNSSEELPSEVIWCTPDHPAIGETLSEEERRDCLSKAREYFSQVGYYDVSDISHGHSGSSFVATKPDDADWGGPSAFSIEVEVRTHPSPIIHVQTGGEYNYSGSLSQLNPMNAMFRIVMESIADYSDTYDLGVTKVVDMLATPDSENVDDGTVRYPPVVWGQMRGRDSETIRQNAVAAENAVREQSGDDPPLPITPPRGSRPKPSIESDN